jgi:serine/threonine protein kinase
MALDRPIALKVLQKKLSHDHALTAQFEKEAALTARINHPNVVRVYSTGSAYGMFYIAMELVDQGSLDGLMEEVGRLPEEDILRLGIQVAEGLCAADRAGLIHRDIKPGNILFSHQRQAKIVDFGLALQSNMAHRPTGEIWGTPFYISPEALALKPEDFRSDMYALGASLWHALTGAPPHLCSSVSIHELLHQKKQPVDLAVTFPGVHPLTAETLNRTLCFDREDRFPNYESLIISCRKALEALGKPLEANEGWSSSKKSRFKYAALVGLTAAGMCGAWWWQKTRPDLDASSAVEPSFQSDAERLSHSVALLSKPGQLDLATRRLELIFNSPQLTPDLQVWTQLSLGIAALLHGDATRAKAALELARARAKDADAALSAFLESLTANAAPGANTSEIWGAVKDLWLGLEALSGNNFNEAKSAFEKAAVTTADSAPEAAVDLLPLAKLLLAQTRNFQNIQGALESALKAEDRPAQLRKAEELLSSMHPAIFLRARAGELLAKAKAAPARPAETKAPQAPPTPPKDTAPTSSTSAGLAAQKPTPPPAPTPPPTSERFEVLRKSVSQHAQKFQFKEALAEAAKFTPAQEGDRNAAALIQRQLTNAQGLFGWAIQEINKGGTLPSPILKNGSAFKSDPIKADEQRLLVSVAPGTPALPIVWADTSLLYLVKLVQFRLTTLPTHPQRAELMWAAGQIHLLLGSKQNAKPFLEEAARLNPAYSELMAGALSYTP